MVDRYEILLDENINLKKALNSTKSLLERTNNDYETLKQLYEEMKKQFERLQKENEELSINLIHSNMEKREIENQFDMTIKNLKFGIEQKQREIEDVQSKVMPNLEIDMIKIKLINELETPHRMQMEAKQCEIEKFMEENYELKKFIDLTKAKMEELKNEKEKDIKMLKDRNKMENEQLIIQLNSLQEKLEDNKDKEIIRNLKRENDELKTRILSKDKDIDEIHDEITKLKEEKHELLIKYNKQIDLERTEKHQIKSLHDKLIIKNQCLDEEILKIQYQKEKKIQEVDHLEKENGNLISQIKTKDDIIINLQKKYNEKEDYLISEFHKHQEEMNKLKSEEQDRLIQERNKYAYLQKQYQNYKTEMEFEIENKNNINEKYLKDFETKKKEMVNLNEENKEIKKQNVEMAKQIMINQKELTIKDEELRQIEKENEFWKNKLRKMGININLGIEPNKENEEFTWRETKKIKPNENNNISIVNEKYNQNDLSNENNILKKKINKLKAKLDLANKKIIELLKDKAQHYNNMKVNKNFTMNEKKRYGTEKFDRNVNFTDNILLSEIQQNIEQGMNFYKMHTGSGMY